MTATATTTCARLNAEVRPFRPVALQLLRMVGDSSVPFSKVAGLVQTDAVLSMELLKIANSPLFPARMEIRSVLQAIVFLGADTVSALVLTTCLRALVATRSSPFIAGLLAPQSGYRPDLPAAVRPAEDSGGERLYRRPDPRYRATRTPRRVSGL